MEFPSTLLLIPTALLSFLTLVFLKSLKERISKSAEIYSHIPGPKRLPLIGNLHLMAGAAAPHRVFRDLAGEHGPLMHLQLGEIHFLVISSVDFAKEVLKTHDVNFSNRPPTLVVEAMTFGYTDVIWAPYGEHWRQMKMICTIELLSARRVQSFRRIREEENVRLAEWVASGEGSPVNLSEKLYESSLDVTTRASVGGTTGERATVKAVVEESTSLASGFALADLYPSVTPLPSITGVRFRIRRMRRNLERVLDAIIDLRKAAMINNNNDNNNDNDDDAFEDLLDILLRIQRRDHDTQLPLTTDNIKAVLLDMFSAGSETSSTTVEWAMSELMKNPDKMSKAQAEVRKVFDSGNGYVDEEKLNELKYMKLVIKETLRLHPPVPFLVPRQNSHRCEIKGYEIPAKTRVLINAWGLGRDPGLWKDAEEFMPERFEESYIDSKGNNLEYIPFGAGRRICPGIMFATASVESTLAMLLYHFDWKMPNDEQELDMTETVGVSVKRKHSLRLIPILMRPLQAPPV